VTGYLEMACHTLIDCIDRLPGDTRTQIGFVTFDRSLHFYSLSEGGAQHEMFVVSDVDGLFIYGFTVA
jgi:protein transport protein SEC24